MFAAAMWRPKDGEWGGTGEREGGLGVNGLPRR